MAPEDRDRNFEKALARQVRANGSDAFDCPDAETLAAYHDRMLSPEEMTAQKSHIAACPRCQEILATLEITEAIPVEAEENQKTFAKTASQALAAVHATPVFSQRAQIPAKTKSPQVAQMPKPKTYLRWAVPAGAIAAGLLMWVAINNSWRAAKMAKTSTVEIAENREQKAAELSAAKPEPPTATRSLDQKMTVELQDEIRKKQELDVAGSAIRSDAKERGRMSAPPVLEHGPRMVQNQAQNQINNGTQNWSLNQNVVVDSNQVPPVAQHVVVPPANAPAPARREQAAKVAAANETPAPAATPAASDKDVKAESSTAASAVQVVSGDMVTEKEKKADNLKRSAGLAGQLTKSAGGATAASLRDARSFENSFIHTPDPQVFWFGGEGGKIFKTKDGGKTILPQDIGKGVQAISGSAPDTNVCWLVAQNGIVLRTVDGGKHWVRITVPTGMNFALVNATDALHAILSDAAGQIRYATNDGGLNWVALPTP